MPSCGKHNTQAERQAAYRQRQIKMREEKQRKKGLPNLPAIASLPGERRWTVMLQQAPLLIATVGENRERYYDDRSETWCQYGRVGERRYRRCYRGHGSAAHAGNTMRKETLLRFSAVNLTAENTR